ncbi:hypothetical protein [Planctomonas deserti]|uniref:hypothetical protein n=1 Tax=Planctomonas deserti TaxID=2144185 RepID=UPI000D3B296D|nr:hypothetical protein [Planctomonas deserti]
MTDSYPPDDELLESATGIAYELWDWSVKAVRARLFTDAVAYVADHLHARGPLDRVTLEGTVVASTGESAVNLFDTELGQHLDLDRGRQWMWWVVEQMVSHRHAADLVTWAERTVGGDPQLLPGSLDPLVEDFGEALMLDVPALSLRGAIIDEVGRLPVRRVLELDAGGATGRVRASSMQRRLDREEEEQRREASQRFYEERRQEFDAAVGLGGPPYAAENISQIINAVRALGWGRHERLMFWQGAPAGTFSLALAPRFTSTEPG